MEYKIFDHWKYFTCLSVNTSVPIDINTCFKNSTKGNIYKTINLLKKVIYSSTLRKRFIVNNKSVNYIRTVKKIWKHNPYKNLLFRILKFLYYKMENTDKTKTNFNYLKMNRRI